MSSVGDFQFDELFISPSPQHPWNSSSCKGSLMYILGTKEADIGNEADVDVEECVPEPDGANATPELVDEAARSFRETVPISTRLTLDSFKIQSLVGKGAYGKVRQVVKKDTKEVLAMKSLHKKHLIETNCVENTLAEKDVLAKIRHPFVVRLHYAFQTPSKLYLIMDFINGGHLLHHLSREFRFSEPQARFYLAEVVLALEHLHSLDIIHRDLKPENVLIGADGHAVLTDFGFAKENVTDLESCKSFCGTLEYMAPEVIKKNRYGKPADWWAVGILLFDMLMGHPPFQHNNDAKLYQKILNDKLVLPTYFTASCAKLLRGLLERNVSKRLTINEIKTHAFFKGMSWDKVYKKELVAPFIPAITEGELDTSQFDCELTKLPSGESPCASPLTNSMQAKFLGFSYVRSFDEFGARAQQS